MEKGIHLQLETTGHHLKSGWGPGVRDTPVIHYIISGKGYFYSGNNRYTLGPGESFVIFPGVPVAYYPDIRNPWDYVWVHFSGLEGIELLAETSLSPDNPIVPAAEESPYPYFERVSAFSQNGSVADQCHYNGILHELLAYYIRQMPAESVVSPRDLHLNQALSIINSSYHHANLSVDKISSAIHLNRVSLYRLFMNEFGQSPARYLSELRHKKACALLVNTNFSVKTVAFSVGYADPLYFSKCFREYAGISPTEYRKKHKIV